nr:T9SS type A sorting domain-containing protein [Chitinophagaceae bacterium]
MKHLIFLSLALLFSLGAIAQVRKTNGVSISPQTVNFTDNGIIDYQPQLIHLDQHPIPSAEYGDKKERLNLLRAQKELELKNQEGFKKESSKKTRGLAPNPTVFKGIQGNLSSSTPNDNDIAVSNGGKVISAVNSTLRMYDDTGKVLLNKSLTSIFAAVGNFAWISDPRLLYDPVEDRFVLVCFSGAISYESQILVGFSQTNDPTGNWNVYKINGNPFNDSTWSDYPIIALSDKDLFMTFNQVKDNVSWTIGFRQSVIWQINKADGFAGNPLQYTLWDSINYNGKPLRNICPAKYQIPPFDKNLYFLTVRNVDSINDSLFVTEIDNSYISGNAQLSTKVMKLPLSYGFPPNAREKLVGPKNNYLMTNDARVLAAIYENGYVHFGSNTVNPAYMNAGVYLGTIKNISEANPVITADIFSSQTMEYGYPSMTVVGNIPDHKILYTFSHCITDSFPGTSVLLKVGNGDYSDIVSVRDGLSIINVLADTVERWGDYTNVQRMYNNPTRAYLSGSWGKNGGNNCWVSIIDNIEWPVGTTLTTSANESSVFPNPIPEKKFTTRFENESNRHLRFEIFDMQGKRISLMLDTYIKKGLNEFSFTTETLPIGNYVFRISTREGQKIASHKITIE